MNLSVGSNLNRDRAGVVVVEDEVKGGVVEYESMGRVKGRAGRVC